MRLSELFEALTPSQYRPLVKGWNKERYADIFKDPKYKHDKNGYRVFIPLGQAETQGKSETQSTVENFLANIGYDVVDYRKGLAKNKKNGQQIKIGKVLQKSVKGDKNWLLDKYTSDKAREGVKDNYIVVISRHPYDIAGMSTNRGWTSCMNLNHGEYREYVPIDVKEGTVIAYVTKASDPDLKNPTGRILIKPFVNIIDETELYFGMEGKVYGTNVKGFQEAVLEWVDWANERKLLNGVAVVRVNPRIHRDDIDTIKVIGNDEDDVMRKIYAEPELVLQMENPTEKQQMVAVRREPYLIHRLPTPSDAVILQALNADYGIFYKLKNPSENVQIAAVSLFGNLLKDIDNPSEAVKEAAVRRAANAIRHIENPSEKLQLIAVNKLGSAIKYIANPSPAVQLAAVRNDNEALEHIKNPTAEAKAEHIKLYRR